MKYKKDVFIEGIIEITKQKHFAKVETRQNEKDWGLEDIVVKALGDEFPEGYGQKFAGSKQQIKVTSKNREPWEKGLPAGSQLSEFFHFN